MMSDLRGDGGSEMTPKNWTLEGNNRTLGGNGGSKIFKNRRTSFNNSHLKKKRLFFILPPTAISIHAPANENRASSEVAWIFFRPSTA